LVIYAIRRSKVTTNLELKALDQWVHGFMLWSIIVTNDLDIVVGDASQSITLLTWRKGVNEREGRLEHVAQDWLTRNSTNVTADEESIIQSDVSDLMT
jgi:hypothetical protein